MECNHEDCSDSDDFEDTVPVVDPRLSFSRYGARGSIAKSLLLPSDAEQMLRALLSIHQQQTDITGTLFCQQSLREEATFIPSCAFEELCTQYQDVKQLQRVLSQDWLQSWNRWLQIQDMISLYDRNQEMKKKSVRMLLSN